MIAKLFCLSATVWQLYDLVKQLGTNFFPSSGPGCQCQIGQLEGHRPAQFC